MMKKRIDQKRGKRKKKRKPWQPTMIMKLGKGKLREHEKKGKKIMRDNLDDEKKHLKKEDKKGKKKSEITLMIMKNEQLKKYKKKMKESYA